MIIRKAVVTLWWYCCSLLGINRKQAELARGCIYSTAATRIASGNICKVPRRFVICVA